MKPDPMIAVARRTSPGPGLEDDRRRHLPSGVTGFGVAHVGQVSRALKTSHFGALETSHFEEFSVRRYSLLSHGGIKESGRGESTQNGNGGSNLNTPGSGLVAAADRPRTGHNRETVGRYAALTPRRPWLGGGCVAAGGRGGIATLPRTARKPNKGPKRPTGSDDPKPASESAPLGSLTQNQPRKRPSAPGALAGSERADRRRPFPRPTADLSLYGHRQSERYAGELLVAEDRATLGSDPSAAAVPNGTGGILVEGAACSTPPPTSRSQCEPFRQVIVGKLEQGLSASDLPGSRH